MLTPETPAVPEQVSILSIIIFGKDVFQVVQNAFYFCNKIFIKSCKTIKSRKLFAHFCEMRGK